jgi:hypothetical protein
MASVLREIPGPLEPVTATPGPTRAQSHASGGDFVLALHEGAAVFGEFAAEQFHDFRPRRNWISRAETNSRGKQAIGQGLVAGHDNLLAVPFPGFNKLESIQEVAQGIAVAGLEGAEGGFGDAFVLAHEPL